jgi:hypothetical protein
VINTRHDLTRVIDQLSLKTGAELGVAGGDFSSHLLSNSSLTQLYSIDKWNDHHDLKQKQAAEEKLFVFGDRSVIIHSTFDEASHRFDKHSLDFIYIDGYAHTGQEGGKTLDQWWPKLRLGGVFSGHDYHEKWQKTIAIVDRFVLQHGLVLNLTKPDGDDIYPSWFTIKLV